MAVFGPHPLLSVAVEPRAGAGGDDIHLHAAGQGVWVSRSLATVGGEPVLCAFTGAEVGSVLAPLLERLPGELRAVQTSGPSGCYVVDRREGERRVLAHGWSAPPSRHEVDELFSTTTSAALSASALVVCNPYPADALPLEVYRDLVADARAAGVPVYVDLSPPRLDSALEGGPDLVKLNDWELASWVVGPVEPDSLLRSTSERLLERGARAALVTRGEKPALYVEGDRALWVRPPVFENGHREGCGDAMMGAMAAELARGGTMDRALIVGAAAGAATFLRHGLATGTSEVIEELAARVQLEELP